MAITRGRASNSTSQTVATATWTDILPVSFVGCQYLTVECVAGSAAPLQVAVAQRANPNDTFHRIGVAAADTPDDWMELAAGQSFRFEGVIDNRITRAMVSGSGGTATCKWSPSK